MTAMAFRASSGSNVAAIANGREPLSGITRQYRGMSPTDLRSARGYDRTDKAVGWLFPRCIRVILL